MRKLTTAQKQMMKKWSDNFSKDKTFWNVGMFVYLVDIYSIFFSQYKMTNSWKDTTLVVMQKITHM